MGYKTIAEQREEEKRAALLWLYVCSKGLLQDFTEFYKLHHSQTLEEIDRELKELLKEKDNGTEEPKTETPTA